MMRLRVLVLLATIAPVADALKLGSLFNDQPKNNPKEQKLDAAVLVPGFLTGANEFQSLCDTLTAGGLPTVAVPFPNWHWIPALGGRSARPMLERIDFTVQHLLANGGDITKIPQYDYSLLDCYVDFKTNPGGVLKVGGSDKVDDYPIVEPRGKFPLPEPDDIPANTKIALIGHSAGGWISRAYLSNRSYGGKAYQGQRYVHSLVTLGTPHGNAPGPAFEGIQWCNQEPTPVRSLAVGGTGFAGDDWGSLTQGAYAFCCPDGTDGTSYDGDGLTPLFSALAMPGARQMSLEGVTHFCWSDVFGGDFFAPELAQDHKMGRPWYGTKGVVEKWADWIVQ